MSDVIDDKSRYYIPFIVERLKLHQETNVEKEDQPLFVIGMNGVQGAGKTTLVCRFSFWNIVCMLDVHFTNFCSS